MQTQTSSATPLPLQDFGALQQRYQPLKLADRAQLVLADAENALKIANALLANLSSNGKSKAVVDGLRANSALIGKMRPSEAKNMLLDAGNDFIATSRHKLAVWRKTLERVAAGEGVVSDGKKEYIPAHLPIAVAVGGLGATGSYLSIIQLVLAELAKADARQAAKYQSDMLHIRRAATVISDCELASAIGNAIN